MREAGRHSTLGLPAATAGPSSGWRDSAEIARVRFFAANIFGGPLWSAVVVLLGYFVGRVAERWVGEASTIVGGTLAAAFLLVAPAIRWLRSRFSPSGFLGLQLTVSAAVFVAAAWFFGSIAEEPGTGPAVRGTIRHPDVGRTGVLRGTLGP